MGQKSVRNNEPTKSVTTNRTLEMDDNGVYNGELTMKRDSRIEKKGTSERRERGNEGTERKEKNRRGRGGAAKKKERKRELKKKKIYKI